MAVYTFVVTVRDPHGGASSHYTETVHAAHVAQGRQFAEARHIGGRFTERHVSAKLVKRKG